MQKEIEPIQQLEQRRERLSHIIRQRESLVGKIGADKVWIGFQAQGASGANLDRVIVRSTPEATVQVGYTRKTVRENISSLNKRVDEINNEMYARKHISILSQVEKLVASGDLSKDDLRFHQQQFEKLQEQNPSLRKAVDRLRKEEEEEEKEKRKAEAQSGTTSFPEGSAEVKSEEMQEPKEETPINDSIPEEKTKDFSQGENSVEERRDYVDGVVKDYLLNKYGSSETLSVFGQEMADLVSPVEMRFRGRWRVREGEDNFREWRSKVNRDFKILVNLHAIPPKLVSPEAQRLKQIKDEMRDRFGIKDTAEEMVSNTFNECLNILADNFSSYEEYKSIRFGGARGVFFEEANRGFFFGNRTRGLGVDVNPPESRSEWRKE